MASNYSFDVVNEYDIAEVTNAVDQAKREIIQRYDFKGTPASVELTDEKTVVALKGLDYQLDVLLDMVRGKFAKRGLSQKLLDTSSKKEEGNPWRWNLRLKKGIEQDDSKKITKLIRDKYPKVKTQIQGDAIRVTSGSKDDLQAVMGLLKAAEFDFPISFNNFR